MFESLLHRFNITGDQLTQDEYQTLMKWSNQLVANQISIGDIKGYIDQMISIVENELTGYNVPQNFVSYLFRKKRNKYLSARLHNYLMLRDFLSAPDKARRFIEKQVSQLAQN